MERSTYPFPLAANSSHHSNYHRFLLGADPRVLAPFPKPYCLGSMTGPVRTLGETLSLPSWRKLHHGAVPWVEGFGPEHYAVGTPPPHRPLPTEYARPPRRFGAFDFVQAADPCVSALALVAGDRRVLEGFIALGDAFCARLEEGAQARNLSLAGVRRTGRMLAGQFYEPNNRWLMPFLHVHSRVLNLTSFAGAPERLACIDPASLARAGERAKREWVTLQGGMLSRLGYRPGIASAGGALAVDGVPQRLLATMEAPRIAVLRILERMVAGDREPSAERLGADLPPAVIASMADQLESLLAGQGALRRPPKVAVPSEGPWRESVRSHLFSTCRGELALLDAAAARARAERWEGALFPTPPLDPAHRHAPWAGDGDTGIQQPTDPELGLVRGRPEPERLAPDWLVAEFDRTLDEVRARLVHAGPADPLVGLREVLPRIDHLQVGAGPEQLGQAALFLGSELGRGRTDRFTLAPLDELFAGACVGEPALEREIGGRSR